MNENTERFLDFIEAKDPHILSLVQWLSKLRAVINVVSDSEMDLDSEADLKEVEERWMREIGWRIALIVEGKE